MPYTAPGGSAVAYDLSTVAYTAPGGHYLSLSIPALPYTIPPGSGIILNLQGSYTAPLGNMIGFDSDPPPAAYVSATESFAVTDTTNAVAVTVYNVGVVESFAVTDSTDSTYTLVYNVSQDESFSVTDTASSELHLPVAATESFAVTDSTDYTITIQKNMVESFAVTDVNTVTGRSTDASVVESFAVTDYTDFNPFPVDATGINFDWRVNHLHYTPPAGNALAFEIPQDGQYFYSADNLIDHSPPSQMPDLPGTMVTGGDPYWSDVVLNIDFKPIPGHPDWYTDTSPVANVIATYYVNVTTSVSRFGSGYGAADLPSAITGSNAYVFANDSDSWWFGADPFTIDVSVMWQADIFHNQAFICQWGGSSECSWWLGYLYGKLGFHWSRDGYDNYWLEVPFSPVVGMWYDISVDRNAEGVLKLYVNTDVIGTIACPDTLHNSTRRMMIGCDDNGGGYDHLTFAGYVGAARITKLHARYEGVKPALTAPYPTTVGDGTTSRRTGIQPTISNFAYPQMFM